MLLKEYNRDLIIYFNFLFFFITHSNGKFKSWIRKYKREETKAIKDRILRDFKNLFEQEGKENYYKPVRVGNIWSNNYIEYESNGDRNKTSVEEYLNKIKPYLRDIINNLKKS